MSPTYQSGQLLIAQKYTRIPIVDGDVVVVKYDNTTIIKRVAYTQGQVVWGVKSQDEFFIPTSPYGTQHAIQQLKKVPYCHVYALHVPKNHLYLLGDNPSESMDSRDFGVVPITSVQAVIHQNPRNSVLD